MDEDENRVLKELSLVLDGYGLSRFSKAMALGYIEKAVVATTDYCRLKKWALMQVNRQFFPPNLSPWQKGCPGLVPGLRAMPVWDPKVFEWVETLETNFSRIKEELLALRGQQGFQPYRAPSWASDKQAEDGIGSITHDSGDWNVFYLHLHNMDFEENRAKCPITTSIIDAIPHHYYHAFFSALAPNTHITKHHGPTNKKLRCHLPLVVPEGNCTLRVGGETIQVTEGKCYVFDDSFEHEATNADMNKSRIALIFDIWHPDFSQQEIKFFKFLLDAHLRHERKISDNSEDNFFRIIEKAKTHSTVDPAALWS